MRFFFILIVLNFALAKAGEEDTGPLNTTSLNKLGKEDRPPILKGPVGVSREQGIESRTEAGGFNEVDEKEISKTGKVGDFGKINDFELFNSINELLKSGGNGQTGLLGGILGNDLGKGGILGLGEDGKNGQNGLLGGLLGNALGKGGLLGLGKSGENGENDLLSGLLGKGGLLGLGENRENGLFGGLFGNGLGKGGLFGSGIDGKNGAIKGELFSTGNNQIGDLFNLKNITTGFDNNSRRDGNKIHLLDSSNRKRKIQSLGLGNFGDLFGSTNSKPMGCLEPLFASVGRIIDCWQTNGFFSDSPNNDQ